MQRMCEVLEILNLTHLSDFRSSYILVTEGTGSHTIFSFAAGFQHTKKTKREAHNPTAVFAADAEKNRL
jgi:hypothetical protein